MTTETLMMYIAICTLAVIAIILLFRWIGTWNDKPISKEDIRDWEDAYEKEYKDE